MYLNCGSCVSVPTFHFSYRSNFAFLMNTHRWGCPTFKKARVKRFPSRFLVYTCEQWTCCKSSHHSRNYLNLKHLNNNVPALQTLLFLLFPNYWKKLLIERGRHQHVNNNNNIYYLQNKHRLDITNHKSSEVNRLSTKYLTYCTLLLFLLEYKWI